MKFQLHCDLYFSFAAIKKIVKNLLIKPSLKGTMVLYSSVLGTNFLIPSFVVNIITICIV